MTGAYVKINRDGKWQAIEIDQMTEQELKAFFESRPEDMLKWIIFLCQFIKGYANED